MNCNHLRLNWMKPLLFLYIFLFLADPSVFAQILFSDPFHGELRPGWTWKRENAEGWRVTERALEIRVEPGNMWGGGNNARNVLVRPIPVASAAAVEVTVTVENQPTEQCEQADLVWYYKDSHMVKIGQELVDGQLSVVMGREENDRTRTIRIIPIEAKKLDLRFVTVGSTISGFYRVSGESEWTKAGECELPADGKPNVSLQVYQGPKHKERWARFENLVIKGL